MNSIHRRRFLELSGAAALSSIASASCKADLSDWNALRFIAPERATTIEKACLADAAALLARAVGKESVPIVSPTDPLGSFDVWAGTSEARPEGVGEPPSAHGAFLLTGHGPRHSHIVGADAEGVRNGVYAWLERLGFRFFRDGERVPTLLGGTPYEEASDLEEVPAFSLRGDMIWDNYLGPKRFCASMWLEQDWERALLYMARNRMNLLEFYPPMAHVLAMTFPHALGFDQGPVFVAEDKHRMMQRVLARGRELGIRFMYVLTYGAFPKPVQLYFSDLEWRNGYCCAHQPELQDISARVWRTLIDELGTDHLYAIRHRGEEEQVYSDPCRSVTKAEGYIQAFDVLERIDPEARATVWTWGESIPDLFESFPENVSAAHIRHGMANVFGDYGEGREQADGRPSLDEGRTWLSAQFTVFGGNEVSLQTAWSDAASLASDARVSLAQGATGFFQWPEWSDTSPWLSEVVAKLGWNPDIPVESDAYLDDYAASRHGERQDVFVSTMRPLLHAGNARFVNPPWKRLLVPYYLTEHELALTRRVQAGLSAMVETLDGSDALFQRDLVDIACWLAQRQAQLFEAQMYLAHLNGDVETSEAAFRRALGVWDALQGLLSVVPERSLFESAKALSRQARLSERFEDSLWELGCAFYHGYPLIVCPEAVAYVYRPQSLELDARLRAKDDEGDRLRLDEPGWFWHDFPDRAWRATVRRLPQLDAEVFESAFKEGLENALASGDTAGADSAGAPSEPSPLDIPFARLALQPLLTAELPAPLEVTPQLP